jgi:hypothetical protein
MKIFFFPFTLCILLSACTSQEKRAQNKPGKPAGTVSNDFFPVTSFIKGQIVEMRSSGLNPLKITTFENHSDSVWLKVEELENAFAEFLSPTIDSIGMWQFFKENKFLDQTLNSYTFTYEPINEVPDSLKIRRWDVYINPKSNSVYRIYIEKVNNVNKQLQLTWQSNEWCKIVTLSSDKSGNQALEKEELFKWKFEQ